MARLDKLAGTNALNVANTIIDNVALGKNPKTIAGLIKNSLGGGLTDALRMTRTVQIWSYRESNRASYIANSDIVRKWIWYSALDQETCASCIAMHGTEHDLDEVLDDHFNGFCAALPLTIGAENPIGVTAGKDYFDSLAESRQREILGDEKWQALQDGKFEFNKLSIQKENDIYGTMRQEATLKELLNE
jgi:hypothetical protein